MADFLEDTTEEYSWKVVQRADVDMKRAVDTAEEANHPGTCFDFAGPEQPKRLCPPTPRYPWKDLATEEVLDYSIDWEHQHAESNDFAAFEEANTVHSSTTVVVAAAAVAAGSYKTADSEAYHTNSTVEENQEGGHLAADGDFRTDFGKRDCVTARTGYEVADHNQAAAESAGFHTDLVDHPEVVVHNAAAEGLDGAKDLAGHKDSVHMAGVVVETDLDHFACEERAVGGSS
jgi:hypothetical protein